VVQRMLQGDMSRMQNIIYSFLYGSLYMLTINISTTKPYLVNILSARGAAHVAGSHESDAEGFISRLFRFGDLGRIKVRRIVFIEHLSLGHF
jgi:hypothetical protein